MRISITTILIPLILFLSVFVFSIDGMDKSSRVSVDDIEVFNYYSSFDGEWNHTYGGSGHDLAYSVDVTSDGGFVLVGGTTSYSSGEGEDVWLIRTDSSGNVVWSHTFGGSDDDHGQCVRHTSDGGFIIVGGTYSYSHSIPRDEDILLIKTDRNGNLVWEKVIGSDMGEDYGWCVQETDDGGYIIAGDTTSYSYSDDAWLIKTDSNGDMVWNRTYGSGSLAGGAFYVEETSDGGYIMTGSCKSGLWIIKTDNNGNLEWEKVFGGELSDTGNCVHETSDGCYIVVGYTSHYGAGSEDVWLIKIDSSGNMIWNRTYGGGSFDWGTYVEETSDGGFIILGNTDFYSHGYSDFWLIKTDGYGNREWSRILGGDGPEVASYLCKSSDGGYVMVGYTKSFGAGYEDFWLVKVMPDDLPPGKPILNGPTSGKINRRYTINFTSVDPEDDNIYYFVVVWYYGVSGWLGPYKSGETASFTFPPTKEGNFNITVKAMDDRGCDGPVSDPIRVTFPKPYWLNLLPPFIQRILSINFFHHT